MANTAHLQQLIDYQFKDINKLELALTHRSCGATNNERLEFLGDSVLNNVVSRYLFEHFPEYSEGDLSRMRASLVSNKRLATIAERLDLPSQIRVGQSLQNGGYRSASVMSDTVEAIIGAIFLDSDWQSTEQFILSQLSDELAAIQFRDNRDAKTKLQEWLQQHSLALPNYQVVEITGPNHRCRYLVSCQLPTSKYTANYPQAGTLGRGSNRRLAEQDAALKALQLIERAK